MIEAEAHIEALWEAVDRLYTDETGDKVQLVYDVTKALDSVVDTLTEQEAFALTQKLDEMRDAHAPVRLTL